MTDMCMYELDDIIWKDLYPSDDDIVIHPVDDQHSFGCNNRKRPRHESILEGGSGGSFSEKHTIEDRAEQIKHITHPKRQMLRKQSADNVFHFCNRNSINEASPLESDGINISANSFNCTLPPGGKLPDKESILSEKAVAVSGSVGHQRLFPETDNILSFFDNNGGKDINDLSGYSWDDLGNFEDVDRMFRSCDSTFGLGTNQEDDLGWLSSSDAIGESENVLNSDFNFSCLDSSSQKSMSESENTSISNGLNCSIDESEAQNSLAIFKGYSQHGILSVSNGTSDSGGLETKDKVIVNGQVVEYINLVQQNMSNAVVATNKMIDEQIKQMELPNQPENHKNYKNVGQSAFSCAADIPVNGPRSIEARESHSCGYLHSDTTFMKSDYSFSSEEYLLHPAQSEIKSENSCPESVSPKDSQASSLQVISFAANEKGELMNWPRSIHSSLNGIPKNMDFAQASKAATISNEKPIHFPSKSDSDGVNIGIHQELGFSVARDSSVSSGLDDISIEATGFHHLQLVMEQLDLRTKLCIRDSLYRLARSAEQRHQYVELNGPPIVDRDSMLAEGSSKFPNFMDMETDTNPIDRSIAYLLFHRPADSPVLAGRGALSFNSPTSNLLHGSLNSSPLMPDVAEVVKREETQLERKCS